MATTWDEIRLVSLQKMFLTTGTEILVNDSTQEYLNAMPGAYNEAVMLISTHDRYITKWYEVECDGSENILVVDLAEIPDLYMLKSDSIYFDNGSGYSKVKGYAIAEGQNLYLHGNRAGKYCIYYYAYPKKVTLDTAGETVLDIDDDVANLVPLYIASQLYKDDDIGLATVYRNEFEVGREHLVFNRHGGSSGVFTIESGWI